MSGDIVNDAAMFAAGAHAGQTYGRLPHSTPRPYVDHLRMVVEALSLWRHLRDNPDLLAAAWLHDTVEDTRVTYDDIWHHFGAKVANMVDAVTDRPGKNRKERHEATYPNIRSIGGDEAIALKLADRIANVKFSVDSGDVGKVWMYREEHADFVRLLRRPACERETASGLVEAMMWDHLTNMLGKP